MMSFRAYASAQKTSIEMNRVLDSVRIPILMYHQIAPVSRFEVTKRGLVVDTRTFRRHMKFLKTLGYTSVCPSDILDALNGRTALPRKPVALTFDDGYAGVHEHAFSILTSYGFTATIYCIAEDYARGVRPSVSRAFSVMSRADIEELLKAGFMLGSHSVSHADLSVVPGERAIEEITRSKAILEDAFGCEVTTFAYPYGRIGEHTQKFVAGAGYHSAVSIRFGRDHSLADQYSFKRIGIGYDQGLVGFLARLAGSRFL